jgi:hypothetical protein
MVVALTLGPVLFADFEIPDKISGVGGKQMLVVHKLTGGDRVVDAMGRDDSSLKWSGRFRGSAAETRARLLDFLRVQGQSIELAWSSFRYKVVVETFDADYEQPFEIPYTVSCLVISDETSPLLTALLGLDAAIGSDLNNIVQIGAALNVPGISTAISGVQTATANVQTFEGASSQTITGVQGAITTALGAVNDNIATNNTNVAPAGSVAGVAAGGDPASLANSLSSQSNSFSALGQLYQIQPALQRMFVNVGNGGQ